MWTFFIAKCTSLILTFGVVFNRVQEHEGQIGSRRGGAILIMVRSTESYCRWCEILLHVFGGPGDTQQRQAFSSRRQGRRGGLLSGERRANGIAKKQLRREFGNWRCRYNARILSNCFNKLLLQRGWTPLTVVRIPLKFSLSIRCIDGCLLI